MAFPVKTNASMEQREMESAHIRMVALLWRFSCLFRRVVGEVLVLVLVVKWVRCVSVMLPYCHRDFFLATNSVATAFGAMY